MLHSLTSSLFHKQRSRDILPRYGTMETKAQTCSRAPLNRFLFRLSPCVNFFYCLLLFNHPMGSIPTDDTAVFGISPRQINTHTRKQRVYNEWAFLSPSSVIKFEYLRECSASRVRPYMHQLRIMSLVKCWVCPAPVFAALCSAIIRLRRAKGELLRLCPGYSG